MLLLLRNCNCWGEVFLWGLFLLLVEWSEYGGSEAIFVGKQAVYLAIKILSTCFSNTPFYSHVLCHFCLKTTFNEKLYRVVLRNNVKSNFFRLNKPHLPHEKMYNFDQEGKQV